MHDDETKRKLSEKSRRVRRMLEIENKRYRRAYKFLQTEKQIAKFSGRQNVTYRTNDYRLSKNVQVKYFSVRSEY